MESTHNIHIKDLVPLTSPAQMARELPITEASQATVVRGRKEIVNILAKEDKRLLVVVGPCSIHQYDLALEYARRLNRKREALADRLCIVMRVYFEKPRTTIGWKGLINDPHLDGSCDMPAGLRMARRILLDITALGLPAGTEMLDPITPQYSSNLISWASIGARTTESQTHREMSSGLSMPIGFKNGTDGHLGTAINAMLSSRNPHSFLGIDQDGRINVVNTLGNPWGHLIMRGGSRGTNYDEASIRVAGRLLREHGLNPAILVDCSHANSGKQFQRQRVVMEDVLRQRVLGNDDIVGVMIESNIHEGSQKLGGDPGKLRYGVSITDACVSWKTTEQMLQQAYDALSGPALTGSPASGGARVP